MTAFDFNAHYSLQVELWHGAEWTVSLNSRLMMDNVTDDSFGNRGNTASGHIGIRNVNSSLTVDSLFVSGTIQFEDDLSFYYHCVPPTGAPSASPTPAPTKSPVPTLQPTANPTQDTTTSLPTISLPTASPSGEPTLEPTVLSLDITVPVGNAAMTQSS